MPKVYVCFTARDRSIAEIIGKRLELTAEVGTVLNQIPAGTLPMNWEAGNDEDGIILLLSRDAVPPRTSRAEWEELLLHVQQSRTPAIIGVVLEDCAYPALLNRHHVVRWQQEATLTALQEWTIRLHCDQPGEFIPAVQPHFENRDSELRVLSDALAKQPGAMVITGPQHAGKTSLAVEFARRSMPLFRRQIWLSCRDRSVLCIKSELAGYGLAPDSPPSRILIVLDGLQ